MSLRHSGGRLAEGGIKIAKGRLIEHGTKAVAQEQIDIPARERRSSDKLGLRRTSRNRVMQRQRPGRYSLQSRNRNAQWRHPTPTSPTASVASYNLAPSERGPASNTNFE